MRGWACLILICHEQKRAFGGWQRSRSRYRSQYMTSTWGHGFRRSWRICALLQMSLMMLAEKRETSPPIFVFRVTYFCSSWKRQSPCFQYIPMTVVVFIRQPSHIQYRLQGRHRRFVGDSAFHTYFGRAPLLVGDTAEVVSPSARSTEFDSM